MIQGPVIALPSRSFECSMPFPIGYSQSTVTSDPSLRAAGADEAEADPAQRIAADPSVIDAERDPLYGDRVKDASIVKWEERLRKVPAHRRHLRGATFDALAIEAEQKRLARLSWWQEQR